MKNIDYAERYKRINAPFGIDRAGISYRAATEHPIRPIGVGSIEYVLSGSGNIVENNKTFHVKAGDVFILHARNYQEQYPDPDVAWSKIWVQLSGHMVPQLLKAYDLSTVNVIPNFDLEEDLRKITEIIKPDTEIETIDREGPRLLLALIQKIHEELCQRNEILRQQTMAQKIRDIIDSVPDGNITVEQLCKDTNFSKRHLNRLFKEEYGLTPKEYILNRRLAIIQSLLKRTNLSIKEIAEKLHFCNAAYLSRFYHEQTGTTALEYRKQNQAKENGP